ncbi:MAG: hypothetical protein A2527_08070 [Candidatus Lambdaproteobacteria bacterium RIFOXYD2_FULL_50_16]|uniref:S1 motif domain-containing protein n=1 Tax=Candidatus Lambdaproteobacteria bacterium RIFOXYD2_FULL_50_16 TaxID=1817772 RepID=A0A1F6GAH5_9PROT|nr:MAG: hypothetical protein A2527_08070 [Candidatus Lambdaproteobacteria bacterium RIFOXYD2_FULL_50_16]
MHNIIAKELGVNPAQALAVIALAAEGATVPFIARYRKEKTGGLDEVQIREVLERHQYLSELAERKEVVLASIGEQGKLDEPLKLKILTCTTKQALEDLYLPFKPKRRTKAMIAKEKGLEPLALLILSGGDLKSWINGQAIPETEALAGARDIIAERIAEDPEPKERLRQLARSLGEIGAEVKKEFLGQKNKYSDYHEFKEPIRKIAAHRYLALRRGEAEKVLRLKIELPTEAIKEVLKARWVGGHPAQLELALDDAWNRLMAPTLEAELRAELKLSADQESIQVFGQNLIDLLLAPMGGPKTVMGLDPGFRTGSKWVVIDKTGKFLEEGTIYPVEPQKQVEKSARILAQAIQKYGVEVISLGNGTASREVMAFVKAMLKEYKQEQVLPVMVNESGASVYSASDMARQEFPDLDVSIRGAVSIARRFQDPLAELVKIDPKSIGVGQYQHDVDQKLLKKRLDDQVESAVNKVGVMLNTASVPLLSYVAGLNSQAAQRIVEFRDQKGGFKSRQELLEVPRFGPKAFEQAAGFLRIDGGLEPLDRSAVHPEAYPLVRRMAADLGLAVGELIGNEVALAKLKPQQYITETLGLPSLTDILEELKKPGRDPRGQLQVAQFDDSVQTMADLQPGMELEGQVTNLTKFGVFVDIGVHQDGLIHLSELADRFIKDASEVCKVGQLIQVRVLSVDLERKRIALSAKRPGAGPKPTHTQAAKASGPVQPPSLSDLAAKFKGR